MWRVKVLLRSYEARELGCVIVVWAFARGGNVVWRRRSSYGIIVTPFILAISEVYKAIKDGMTGV